MRIEAGQQLLHYRLTEKIGEGGMGVVWAARDTSLDRDVAIKLLPDEVATDPDRLARFEREAKLLATLDHPNIASVFGLHEAPAAEPGQSAVRFIAMERVEGDTLADRLWRARTPLDDTLEFGRQIAEALEAAHDRGIVHRDLKPANVKVRPDGVVKVLDFGLARGGADSPLGEPGPDTPTATMGTQPGVILGTVPYISPEQARGKPVDKRTDIWALGCLLYECLAGRKPFDGDSMTDVLSQIITAQPDFSALPDDTPPFLVRLLHRCLEKDARRRLRDAGEVRVAIETYLADPQAPDATGTSAAPERRRSGMRTALPWVLAGALGLLLAWVWLGRGAAPGDAPAPVSRWTISLPPDSRVALPSPGGGFDYSRTIAISPDGSSIAFPVQRREDHADLYVKTDGFEPRALDGATNARGPFFSPEGDWLGYYGNDDDAIYKIALAGGAPQKLSDIERSISFDASWAPDGRTIVFATDDGLWRVPADGGPIEQLTEPDRESGEVGHHFPRFTGDGESVLFTVSAVHDMHLAVLDLANGTWRTILPNASSGVPLGDDRIVVARSGELLVAPYDVAGHEITGSLVPVEQGLHTLPGLGGVVLTQFDVARNGTLAYVPAPADEPPDSLYWVDRQGNASLITAGEGTWVHPRLSPDGTRISLDIHSRDGMRDVHVYEIERGQLRQLTRTGMTWESEWSPDGARIATLSAAPAGQWSLHQVASDFSGPPQLLHRAKHAIPVDWLADGASLLFTDLVEGGVWRISTQGDRKPELLMQTSAREGFPRVSPDGQWIVYVETVAGRREVFVQPYPELGAKHQVSIDGGGEPVWSRDGRTLFFRNAGGMYAVDVSYRPAIRFGPPRLLFRGEYDSAEVGHQHYDISLDDRRFLMIRHGVPDGPREVRVVLNWSEEVGRR